MIDFLLTPIGIWVGLLVLAGISFVVGAILSLMNSLWGEGLAMYSASAIGIVGIIGALPALYLSGMMEALMVVATIYVVVLGLFLLFVFVMAGSESSRGY